MDRPSNVSMYSNCISNRMQLLLLLLVFSLLLIPMPSFAATGSSVAKSVVTLRKTDSLQLAAINHDSLRFSSDERSQFSGITFHRTGIELPYRVNAHMRPASDSGLSAIDVAAEQLGYTLHWSDGHQTRLLSQQRGQGLFSAGRDSSQNELIVSRHSTIDTKTHQRPQLHILTLTIAIE